MEERKTRDGRRTLWPAGITAGTLVVLLWGVYRPSIDAPFFFDDHTAIVRNESIVSLWPLVGDAINPGPLNPPPYIPTSARPAVNLSFALNYAVGGLDPAGFRLVNLGLHFASAMLLWSIVLQTLQRPRFAKLETAAPWLASAIAILWAVHPIQAETVVYATQRTELLMALLYLATLWCSLRYWASATNGKRGAWLSAAVLTCAIGMLSKEVMVSAPLMVLLYERAFEAGSLRNALRNSWPLYLGLFGTWIILVFLHRNNPHGDVAGFGIDVSLLTWWFTQAKVVLLYFKLAFWPWPLQIHYHVRYLESVTEAWPYLLAVAMIGLSALFLLWRNTPTGYLMTWVFVVLSPTSLIPIITETAAERRMYLPLAAIVTLTVIGGYVLCNWLPRRMARSSTTITAARTRGNSAYLIAIASVVAIIALAGLSADRVAAYQRPLGLWLDVVERQPDNYLAYQNVGAELTRAGRPGEAIQWYQRALSVKPDNPQAYYQLGLIYMKTDRIDDAISAFRETAKRSPEVAEHRNNLGAALFKAKRYEESITHFRRAFELDPQMWTAHLNLANALAVTDRLPEAVEQYELALAINPKALHVYALLADANARLDRASEAIAVAERALALANSLGNEEAARTIAAQLARYRNSLAEGGGDPNAKTGSKAAAE